MHTRNRTRQGARISDGGAIKDEFTRPPLLEGRAAHNRRLPTSRTGLSESNFSSRTRRLSREGLGEVRCPACRRKVGACERDNEASSSPGERIANPYTELEQGTKECHKPRLRPWGIWARRYRKARRHRKRQVRTRRSRKQVGKISGPVRWRRAVTKPARFAFDISGVTARRAIRNRLRSRRMVRGCAGFPSHTLPVSYP